MKRTLLAAVIALMPMAAIAQDYDKGLAAYFAGDYTTALKEWRPLAEQGYVVTQLNLGFSNEIGSGMHQNNGWAAQWYHLAAKKDHVQWLAEKGMDYYQYALGLRYYVDKDFAEAKRWFRLAADQGYAKAQGHLGIMYLNGEGVRRNIAEAMRWFRLAASQGDARAQSRLGDIYFKGYGVLEDYVSAHMWYNISAANHGILSDIVRDATAKLMTPEQIAEAQRRAKVCMKSNYTDCD